MPLEDSDEILPKEMNDIWRWVITTDTVLFIHTLIHSSIVLLVLSFLSMIRVNIYNDKVTLLLIESKTGSLIFSWYQYFRNNSGRNHINHLLCYVNIIFIFWYVVIHEIYKKKLRIYCPAALLIFSVGVQVLPFMTKVC